MSDYAVLGTPRAGGVLVAADHAGAAVPADVDLGIPPEHLHEHIAVDLGVAEVTALLVERFGFQAILGTWSRLVVDLNRDPDDPAAIPTISDGVPIPGNQIDTTARTGRIARFHEPYHAALSGIVAKHRPALILSLHSFTPVLKSRPHEHRPWQVGVLYGATEEPSRTALRRFEAAGLVVGDQQPYSGKLLNATMNRHAEANGIAYVGIEMRQDEVVTAAGQERMALLIGHVARDVLRLVRPGQGGKSLP